MNITDIRVKLVERSRFSAKALAYVRVVFDDAFAVWDLRIIQGERGPFVVMPSRKVQDRCSACEGRNTIDAMFCNWCGVKMDEDRFDCPKCGGSGDAADPVYACPTCKGRGTARLYEDVFHPVTLAARHALEDAVLQAYRDKLLRVATPAIAETTDSHHCNSPDCGFCVAGKGD